MCALLLVLRDRGRADRNHGVSSLVKRFTSKVVLQGIQLAEVTTLTTSIATSDRPGGYGAGPRRDERSAPCPPAPVTPVPEDHAEIFSRRRSCRCQHLGGLFPQVRALCGPTVRRNRRTDRGSERFAHHHRPSCD